MATRKYKVRFHLGAGENYMKWRVEDTSTKYVLFYEPSKMNAIMYNCKLHNQKSSAIKIHNGANKSVCAWIMCETFELSDRETKPISQIRYNPKNCPNWVDEEGNDVDKKEYSYISINNKTISII